MRVKLSDQRLLDVKVQLLQCSLFKFNSKLNNLLTKQNTPVSTLLIYATE